MRALPVALEITPPAAPNPRVLLRRAAALGPLPSHVHVISRPDRWSSLAASIRLREAGLEPVWHVANRGRSADAIDADIRCARAAGLSRVLCIRGDHKAEDGVDTPKIREVVHALRRGLPGAQIGVTLDPHRDRARAMRNLWAKLDAGARFVQTQLCLELAPLRPLADELKAARPEVAILPMLMPVLSEGAARRLSRRLSIPLPIGLARELALGGARAGWRHFASLVAAIRADPSFDGIALMTPIDVEPALAARLVAELAPISASDRSPPRR